MSVDRLRDAARLLRERAEGATRGPWRVDTDLIDTASGEGGDSYVVSSGLGVAYYLADLDGEDAAYVATVDPVFGLAVATLLDSEARRREIQDGFIASMPAHERAGHERVYEKVMRELPDHWLAVADTILGGAK